MESKKLMITLIEKVRDLAFFVSRWNNIDSILYEILRSRREGKYPTSFAIGTR